MSNYPAADRQQNGFGIRYLKWLFDSGVAHEIGPDATALLTAVVTLEDEFFYSRAVGFFNDQLMQRCGIKSIHALIRARKIAVDANLLNYTPGQKRKEGKYFVCGFSAQSAPEVKRKSKGSETEVKRNQQLPNPIPKPIPERARSAAPSPDDVCDFAKSLDSKKYPNAPACVDPFFDHYQSNGWKVGRNVMKDWQATFRNWVRRQPEFSRNGRAEPVTTPEESSLPMMGVRKR